LVDFCVWRISIGVDRIADGELPGNKSGCYESGEIFKE